MGFANSARRCKSSGSLAMFRAIVVNERPLALGGRSCQGPQHARCVCAEPSCPSMYWKNWRPVNGRQRLSNSQQLGDVHSNMLFAWPARRDGCRPSRRPYDNQKGIGKLLESSLPRCPKATTVALKQENAFARQTAATIARTDGRGSFWPKVGSCWQRPKRSQRTVSK